MKGWKHKKTPTIVGNEKTPTKMESGQVIINKKATKENLNKLIEINNDGLDTEKSKVSTDGTEGGILKGKPHYDKNGKSLGGIPVVVDGAKKIEVEGDEFVVNKEASQKHWKELSKINQSAGNGVPINPSDVGADTDPEEFRKGGKVIEFNPNHLPSSWIYSYAKKIKEKYPKVWDKGGNIFGNEAFVNLERVIKRGYWKDSEEWMYIKWRSYVARHHKDYRIEGTVAMLKWIDKTDKGWDYMKALIEKEIAKKYPKKGFKRKLSEGGGIKQDFEISKIKKLVESNLDINKYKIITEDKSAFVIASKYKDIRIEFRLNVIKDMIWFGGFSRTEISSVSLADPSLRYQNTSARRVLNKKINIRKGVNSYSELEKLLKNFLNKNEELKMQTGGMIESQPPANFENVLYKELANRYEYGGGVNDITCKSCNWSWNKSDSEKHDEYVCHKCGTDNKMKYGGELAKGIKVEAEHQNTFKKVYAHKLTPMQAPVEVAKEHLKEDKNYYSKLGKMEKFNTGGAATGFEDGDILRAEYYPGIYGNFLAILAGADAVKVKNLLTGEESVKDYRDFTLFLKKGSVQVATSSPVKSSWPSQFKFDLLQEVIYKINGEKAKVIGRNTNTGNKFYIIEFSGGDNLSKVKETELEEIVTLDKGQPTMPMPNLPATDIKPTEPTKPKFVPMDFKPFLENWVNSNFMNVTNMDKKEIVRQTIQDYILDVEAVDNNQNITFKKEAEILDKLDNYIN